MARLQISLSDGLAKTLKEQDLNVSKICQEALARAGEVCPTCGHTLKEKKAPRQVIRTPRRPVQEERRPQESIERKRERIQAAIGPTNDWSR